MAQIIKHRRGLIGGVKNLTARNGELIIASGSISDLSGPFVFIGSPNTIDEGVAGAFNSVSKLYTGTAAPTITAATYGSALDGTPYYASGNKSLYILNNSNVGNTQIDLTGNIEGNTISGVTINKLQSTTVSASFFTGSFVGDGTGLYNVPASGVTGLELNRISDGSATASISQANGLRVNVNTEITGTLNVNGNTSITGTFVATDGAAFINQGVISQNSNLLLTSGSHLIIQDSGNAYIAGDSYITGSVYVDDIISRTGNSSNALHLGELDVELTSDANISLYAEGGTVNLTGSLKVTGNATLEQDLYVSGNIYQTGSFYTQGDIILSGSINIGNSLTGDTINFGGEVSSSILPQTHNAFDLGSPDKNWRNLHISGTAYIDVLEAQQVNFNDLGVLTDLVVSGSTYLGNGNDIVVISGSIYNDQLTQGRIVHVGANGELVDNENFTYDLANGFLLNTSGSININTSGSLNVYTHDGDDVYVSSSSDITLEASTDITITAGDDLRLYSNDIFSLRNYSADESITLVTNYNDVSKTLEFDVNGNLTIPEGFTGSYLDINTQAQLASAAVEDLTDNRIVLAGVGGELEDDANFTFDGTTFKVGDGDFEIDVLSGDTRMSGSLLVKNNAVVTGSLFVTKIQGTGSLYLQADQGDSRHFEIYNTSTEDTHIKSNGGLSFFGDDINYLKIDDVNGTATIVGVNGVSVSSSLDVTGSIYSDQLTDNRVLIVGSNGVIEDDANFVFDGTILQVGQGLVEIDTADGDIRTSGSLTIDNIYGKTNSTNSLHLNGGDSGAPHVELESVGQISLFSEGVGSNYAINMTGSVYLANDLNVTGSSRFLSGVTLNSTLTITGLTDNRVVIVGTGGQLEDDANFTFDGTTFKVGDGDFEVDLSGNTRMSGSFLVKNGVEITGSLRGQDSSTNWSILGNGFGETQIQSATGNMLLQATTGEVVVKTGNFHVETNAKVDGTLQVSGNTSLTGSLTVASGSATMLGGDLYVSGNLQVLGSSTNVSIQSQTVDIGDNIIQVNAYSPFDRYAGLAAYDSGSSGDSGSFLWDSTNDYWLIVNASSYSSKVIGTTASTGGTGTEISLTSGTFPIATASNTIGDSLLTYSGTTLAYNTNKFTVDSTNGDTAISGNLTLSYSGGTDGGTKTSRVTFRNSSNVLGYVPTNETTNELDGILGYNHSSGVLEFSTLIDGGTY